MEFRVEQHRDTHMKDGTTLTATMERLFGTKVGTTIEVVSYRLVGNRLRADD